MHAFLGYYLPLVLLAASLAALPGTAEARDPRVIVDSSDLGWRDAIDEYETFADAFVAWFQSFIGGDFDDEVGATPTVPPTPPAFPECPDGAYVCPQNQPFPDGCTCLSPQDGRTLYIADPD